PSQRPGELPPLSAGLRPPAAGSARCAPEGRPADHDLRPRVRPDDGVDRSLARARAADRLCAGKERRRAPPRGRRVRGRRGDGQPVARRGARGEGDAGPPDRRVILPAELIQRKRDGQELADEEITELVLGYARGAVPDYQLAAFCMAVYFRGLTP